MHICRWRAISQGQGFAYFETENYSIKIIWTDLVSDDPLRKMNRFVWSQHQDFHPHAKRYGNHIAESLHA